MPRRRDRVSFPHPHDDLQQISIHDANRMTKSQVIPEDLVIRLWDQKTRLDRVFDANDGLPYYIERDEVFPMDKKSSSPMWNRVGDKLLEVVSSMFFESYICIRSTNKSIYLTINQRI